MALDDLRQFFDPRLSLPIGGRVYVVEPPTAEQGLRLHALLLGDPVLDDDAELAEIPRVLGSAYEQMRADGVRWDEIVHAGRTALLHYGQSPEVAERFWGGGPDPGNPPPPEPARLPGGPSACATASAAAS